VFRSRDAYYIAQGSLLYKKTGRAIEGQIGWMDDAFYFHSSSSLILYYLIPSICI
jgi:hypothetical protein